MKLRGPWNDYFKNDYLQSTITVYEDRLFPCHVTVSPPFLGTLALGGRRISEGSRETDKGSPDQNIAVVEIRLWKRSLIMEV